ncbi:astacin [Ancylostoma caninum]|uniref:Metalloendopeptidase n=1 Tax=Ancylostoma caninum TaxID=29170 RepID=A0A368GYT4_ANCCA|nr:astacin [Ancylostoma caninum]
MAATRAWEKDTCIKFINNRTAGSLQVGIFSRGGCYYQGNGKSFWMNVGCGHLPSITHELGHAIGLGHTHNRHDRDEYLRMDWGNVDRGFYHFSQKNPGYSIEVYRSQYKPMTKEENENYGVPYDFGSIMHYGVPLVNPAMTPNDKNYERTIGSGLISFVDLLMVNKHFKCEGLCDPSTSAKCTRDGFPNPNDCNTCVCPGGYGGRLCEEKPYECTESQTVTATKDWNQVQRNAYNQIGDRYSYFKCTSWIKSPNGTKIVVEISDINSNVERTGCVLAGIEIKTQEDQRLTGYRYATFT